MSQEGFEPSTPALKGRYSTAELLARTYAVTFCIGFKNKSGRGVMQEKNKKN
jgi:hypothetical protein